MRMCKTSLRPALIIVAATMAAMLGTTHASAIKEVDQREFGMVGIVRGQALRLNVVSIDNPDFKPAPVRLELMFLDSEGNLFLNPDGTPVRKRVVLAPGQADFLDISFPPFLDGGRIQIRAVMRSIDNPDLRGIDNPDFITTLEGFDTETGRTFFVIEGRASGRSKGIQ